MLLLFLFLLIVIPYSYLFILAYLFSFWHFFLFLFFCFWFFLSFFFFFCSFHNLQQDKRSKTQWHKPLTNVIFSSHFKGISRNEEFHIDQLVAKGAFGVVFKVINKKQQEKQQAQQQDTCPTVYALKVLKKSKVYKLQWYIIAFIIICFIYLLISHFNFFWFCR